MAWKFNPFTNKLDFYLSTSDLDSRYVNVTGDTMAGTLNMNLNEILNIKVENLSSLPASGNLGRIAFLTTDLHLYLDQG